MNPIATTYCPTCGQPNRSEHDRPMLGTSDRIVMGLSEEDLEDLVRGMPGPSLIVRMLRALALIAPERATELARRFGLTL